MQNVKINADFIWQYKIANFQLCAFSSAKQNIIH